VASTVGFSSLGHFTEVFKKQYSLPPANYRRKWNIYFDSFDEINE
jgi:AraC-like DNA-binding protein